MAPATRHPAWILFLLGALCVVTPFAIDMYLPAFSTIAREFHTTSSAISLSLSTYFVGFALGQLIYGPLLDRFGRRRPLCLGLLVFILGSVGCALAPTLHAFIAFRFFQALAGCVAQVGAIAMVRDFFPVEQSAKIFSLLFLMIGLSPLLAPTIGSLLVSSLGWHWIFGVLAALAFTILLATFFLLPEGHQPDRSVSLRPGSLLRGFWYILLQPQFTVYTLAGAFSFAGLFAYVAGSPLIFMDGFHVSARTFGLIFTVLVMGFIGGNQLNILLLRRFKSRQIFFSALVVQVFTGAVFLSASLAHVVQLSTSLVLFFVFLSCIGLTNPNSAALALAPFTKDAGRSSALLGCLQAGIGAVVSSGIGVLGVHSVVPLQAGSAFVAFGIYLWGRGAITDLVEQSSTTAVLH